MIRLRRCVAIIVALLGIHTAAHAQPAAPLPAMQTIAVYGQPIRYMEAGSGPTLVLVHGLGSNARFDWGKVIPQLAQHYHVLAMDQLGFGTSAKPLIAYGVQTWVDMLDGFLTAKHITHFMLMGESLGGWIAGLYTVEAIEGQHMPIPDRLILSDAAGHHAIIGPAHHHPFGGATSLAAARSGLKSLFHDQSLITDDLVRQSFQTRLAEGNQFTQLSFWRNIDDPSTFLDQRLGVITIPTLIVWGADDQILPLADGRDFARKIKGARLAIIPESGHGPMIERPDAFLKAISGFLAGGR